jgi:hypothetical protein
MSGNGNNTSLREISATLWLKHLGAGSDVDIHIIIIKVPDSIFNIRWELESACQDLAEHTGVSFRKTALSRHDVPPEIVKTDNTLTLS